MNERVCLSLFYQLYWWIFLLLII